MKRQWTTTSVEETQELAAHIAALVSPGDVILLHGGLGAGKTTFTQGLAAALGVEGRVTSPTFIVSREHDNLGGGPGLVHVDAYRIEDGLDLATLDLERSLDSSVIVIEWGAGKVEGLSDQRLEITFETSLEGSWEEDGAQERTITIVPVGQRWIREFPQEDTRA